MWYKRWICFWKGHPWIVEDGRRLCTRCLMVVDDEMISAFEAELGRKL